MLRRLAPLALAAAFCLASPALAWLPHGTAGSGCTSGPCTVQLPLSTPSIVKPPISSVVLVHSGGNLQTALNAATPGTAIIVDAGANFTNAYTLPNTSCGGGWITLESAGSSALIPGVRVAPAQVADMTTITVPSGNQSAFTTATSACKYWIDGFEIYEPAAGGPYGHPMISIGTEGETSNSQLPNYISFDRDYAHGQTTLDLTHAFALDGGNLTVSNSYISEIHSAGNDSQGFFIRGNASGPMLLQNNYVEAAGENSLVGGEDPSILGQIPSDLTWLNNFYYKDPSWLGVWDIKNLWELKVGNRILAEWNFMENNWHANQNGYSILMKADNQNGGNSTVHTSNVTFQDNVVANSEAGFNIATTDVENGGTALATDHLNINNNLFYGMSSDGIALALSQFVNSAPSVGNLGLQHIFFTNNSLIVATGVTQTSGDAISMDYTSPPAPEYYYDWNYNDNIFYTMAFDIHNQEGGGSGAAALNIATTNGTVGTFTGNVNIGGPGPYTGWPGNFFPSSVTFVNPADGDYRVAGGLFPGAGSQVIAPQTPNCSSTSGVRSQYLGQPVLIFTANDTLVCTNGFSGHVMLVGGGAGGGCLPGGAGVYSDNASVSIPSGSTTITVGAGGTAGNCSTSTAGGAGGSSGMLSLAAAGGTYNGGGTATSNQITGTPVNYGCPGGSTPGSACSADVGTLNSTAAAALNPQAGTGDGAGDTTASFTGTAGAVGTVIITCADERTC